MKRILILLASLSMFIAANANELENTLNKVYEKGSETAEGYISNLLSGPGDTEVSIRKKNEQKTKSSIIIVRPYVISKNSVIFYQAQFNTYDVEGDARQSLNYGIGKRFLSNDESYFWGMNTFIDLDVEGNNRLGFGSEYKASAFNINGNYYLDAMGGGNQVGNQTERVLDGYDINITGDVPYAPWAHITYNDYEWKKEKGSKNSKGSIYTVAIDLSNNLTFEIGRDDNNLTNYSNFAKLIYVAGSKKRPNAEDGFSSEAFQNSDVSKDMLTKVKRSNIITLEVESSGVVLVNGN
jgi:adhesin/invasin